MISLLTSLKPFKGNAIQLQENALSNWRRLDPFLEIIIYGGGEGISERARRFDARHIPDIRCSAKGIPDFSAIVEHAALNARHDIQVYLNGDILLPPDFILQVKHVAFDQYLIVGQRIDLMREAVFNHLAYEWNNEIRRNSLAGKARLHAPTGEDYFVFPRGLWRGLKPLFVGRGGYDNALIAHCLRRRIPIVDATWSIHVVHQWHDYQHAKGANATFSGEDALSNRRLHDIEHSCRNVEDANWRLIDDKIIPSKGSSNPIRRLEIFIRYRWGLKHFSYLCRAVTRLAMLGGWLKSRELQINSIIRK